MAWNDVVTNVRDTIRRGLAKLGGGGGGDPVATSRGRLEPLGDAPLVTPAVDVHENERELLIVADVPGGSREGATVAWDDGRLTLQVVGLGCTFQRAFELAGHLDGARATSTIRDGVLSIHIPRRAGAPKLIPVRGG